MAALRALGAWGLRLPALGGPARAGPLRAAAGRLHTAAPAAPLAAPRRWAPPPAAPRLVAPSSQAAGARQFATRKDGTVKMWNDERGFGFITPAEGGDDVFVHRTSLPEGLQLSAGLAVTYDAEWDDKKRKERAANISAAPAGGTSGDAPGTEAAPAAAAGARPTSHSIVADATKWEISRSPMEADGDGQVVRHRLTVRQDAPKGSGPELKKEEFQIVGNGSWDRRLYPAGGDREETVLLKPGGPASRAGAEKGKGHGRNWAVEGRAGDAFDILYDPEAMSVSCRSA